MLSYLEKLLFFGSVSGCTCLILPDDQSVHQLSLFYFSMSTSSHDFFLKWPATHYRQRAIVYTLYVFYQNLWKSQRTTGRTKVGNEIKDNTIKRNAIHRNGIQLKRNETTRIHCVSFRCISFHQFTFVSLYLFSLIAFRFAVFRFFCCVAFLFVFSY